MVDLGKACRLGWAIRRVVNINYRRVLKGYNIHFSFTMIRSGIWIYTDIRNGCKIAKAYYFRQFNKTFQMNRHRGLGFSMHT